MTNPLLSPSTLPYGLPPFSDIEDAHYAEAVEAGLAEHLAEIQAIVSDPAGPKSLVSDYLQPEHRTQSARLTESAVPLSECLLV